MSNLTHPEAHPVLTSPYRVREWRRGTVPDSTHLFALISLAEEMGLDGLLIRPRCRSTDRT